MKNFNYKIEDDKINRVTYYFKENVELGKIRMMFELSMKCQEIIMQQLVSIMKYIAYY